MLPDFIIFGALKGGTTSLYQYLKQHPEVYMNPSLKEARFFAYDEDDPILRNKPDKLFPIKTFEAYQDLFEGVSVEKAVGEASPGYLESPIAATRIKASIPDIKLIASLRNPVERAYSLYLMAFRSGSEKRSTSEAFEDTGYWYQRFGYYKNLKRYFDQFDDQQIKIILFEDIKNDDASVTQDLYRFIGVDDSFVPDTSTIHNPGGIPKNRILNTLLKNKLPKQLKSLLPKKSHLWVASIKANIKKKNLEKAPPLPVDLRARLALEFRDDILKLQDLLKRDLSMWLDEEH